MGNIHVPVSRAIQAAAAARAAILTGDTDSARLVDGAGDGLPGLIIETFAGRHLVSTMGGSIPHGAREWLEESGYPGYWKRLDRHARESPVYLSGPAADAPFLMKENGIELELSFQAGYSQGIFLDQRDNRAEVRRRMAPGLRILNTFAYTGAFSVAAAMAGAETTTLDLSQPYLDWAKRNFTHNSLNPAEHHFCKGDAFHWLRRFAKQGRRFDGIILDPPTFSRSETGKVFRAAENSGELAALADAILAPGGWLLCSTNCRSISTADFQRQLQSAIPRRTHATATPMPADFPDEPYLKSIWIC